MSIFTGTISNTISSQLKARESVVSQNTRDHNFLMYTTGKNSWVRLRSFVDYTSYKLDLNADTKLSKDEKYTGSNLSRKWVLEGGTLYNKGGTPQYALRSGIGAENSIYASDLDFNNQSKTSKAKIGLGADRPFGLRPMPGITSVEIMNKSAYGSLREATINFHCWDRHQLEELEILYMRPGYSCYLEWGWSQYLDHDVISTNSIPSNIGIKTFDTNVLDVWRTDLYDDKIYSIIDNAVLKHRGNYGAMLGYVKNYSWQLMPNGGFQCSTTLISRGEAIDSIKASSNPNIILGSTTNDNDIKTSKLLTEDKPVYSQFEKIFLNLMASFNDLEFFKTAANAIGGRKADDPGEFYSTDDKDLRDKLIIEADKVFNDVNERLLNGSYKITNLKEIDGIRRVTTTQILVSKPDEVLYNTYTVKDFYNECIDLKSTMGVKLVEGGTTQGIGIEYIRITAFIAILNEFFIPKNTKTNLSAINIALPFENYCLASKDSVSIDPTTCMIYNSLATFITDDPSGFQVNTYNIINNPDSPSQDSSNLYVLNYTINKFPNNGDISTIFISISKILQIYRNLASPDGVDVIKLLQEVLDACSFALGGINDFQLYNDRGTVHIIDIKYLGNQKASEHFKFDLIGLKSICRDVKINSRIFSEQSSMIAIGATSGDDNTNLGDIYSSTQRYFNYGLQDRILKTTFSSPQNNTPFKVNGIEYKGEMRYYWEIYNNVDSLTGYLKRHVTGELNSSGYYITKLPQDDQVRNASSLLKTLLYQINGDDVNFKALIPFELEITLDGIDGLVIGQIFTIDKSILPKDYFNKNLGFIITGISHSLQNNDWVTNIKTQICLLENDKIKGMFGVDKNNLKSIITELRKQAKKQGYLLCALADYLVHLTMNVFRGLTDGYLGSKLISNEVEVSGLNDLYPLFKYLSDPNLYKKMVGDGANIPEHPTAMSYFLKLNKVGKEFDDQANELNTYLKNWHQYSLSKNYDPDTFPQTYDEFITGTIDGVDTKFDSSAFLYSIFSYNGKTDKVPTTPEALAVEKVKRYKQVLDNRSRSIQTQVEGVEIELASANDFVTAWNTTFFKKIIDLNSSIMADGGSGFGISSFPKPNTNTWSSIYSYVDTKTSNSSILGQRFDPSGDKDEILSNLEAMFLLYLNYLEGNQQGIGGLVGFGIPSDFNKINYEKISTVETVQTNKVEEQNNLRGAKY